MTKKEKYNKIIWLIIINIILININTTYAQQSGGGYAEAYLLRPVGARALSMGGAYTSVSGEPMTLFYNPAGLSLLTDQTHISTFLSFLDYGRKHGAVVWGQSFEDFGVGLGLNLFSSGTLKGRDIKGNFIGNQTNWQYSLTAGASYTIEFASVGASVKYLHNSLSGDGASADGYSFDVGTFFNVADLFAFAVSMQNISGVMIWNTPEKETNLLPYSIRTGISFEISLGEGSEFSRTTEEAIENPLALSSSDFNFMIVSIDAVFNQYQKKPSLILGVEIIPDYIIAFRGGIDIFSDSKGELKFFNGNNFGAGFSFRPDLGDLPIFLEIDYTASSDFLSNYKIIHSLSLNIIF